VEPGSRPLFFGLFSEKAIWTRQGQFEGEQHDH